MTDSMIQHADEVQNEFKERIAFIQEVLQRWLEKPQAVLACGRWSDGTIAEINPEGQGRVVGSRYRDCFAGVCDIRLDRAPHHLHVDLGRVYAVRFCLSPSVCFGFKPSLEARFMLTGPGGAASERWSLAAMIENPYPQGTLDEACLAEFLEEAADWFRRAPRWAGLWVDPEVWTSDLAPQIERAICKTAGVDPFEPQARHRALGSLSLQPEMPEPGDPSTDPPMLPLLREAVDLPGASLVILRERTLIELQTEQLAGVSKFVEQGYVSWQIGGFEQSHCHLDLYALTGARFTAEPTPCQGGRLNFTLWLLVAERSGNPYKADGYFSIVLNQPYDSGGRPRWEVIQPMVALYRAYRQEPWLDADDRFQRVATDGVDALLELNASQGGT